MRRRCGPNIGEFCAEIVVVVRLVLARAGCCCCCCCSVPGVHVGVESIVVVEMFVTSLW